MKSVYDIIKEAISDSDVETINKNKEEILKSANIKFKKAGSVSRYNRDEKYPCFTIKYLNQANVWWSYNFTVVKAKHIMINGLVYNNLAAELLKIN